MVEKTKKHGENKRFNHRADEKMAHETGEHVYHKDLKKTTRPRKWKINASKPMDRIRLHQGNSQPLFLGVMTHIFWA